MMKAGARRLRIVFTVQLPGFETPRGSRCRRETRPVFVFLLYNVMKVKDVPIHATGST